MTETLQPFVIDRAGFVCISDSEALRADSLCQELLLRFYHTEVERGADPIEATDWARGADYFLRDFLIDIKRANLFDEEPGMIRQFAGNWYVVSNLQPDFDHLYGQLEGVRRFYRFLNEQGAISSHFLARVEEECGDREFYRQRLHDFWTLSGDGYIDWDAACPFR